MQEMIVTTQNFRRKGMKEREKGDQRERQCIPEDEGTKNFIHHKNLDQ